MRGLYDMTLQATMTMSPWIDEELRDARLGDRRRTERLKHIIGALDARPHASLPEALGTWAATKAAYRFWSSPHMMSQQILQPHYRATARRIGEHDLVLGVQDTTEFDFTSQRSTSGLGHLNSPHCRGLKMHSVLGVSTEGVPLGVLDEQCWARDLASKGSKAAQRPIFEKESYRWLTSLRAAEQRVASGQHLLIVADQEADLFELLAMPRRAETDLLVRAHHNRKLVTGSAERTMRQAVESSPVIGTRAIDIPRADDRAARTAHLSVRVARVMVAPPTAQQHRLLPVQLSVLLLSEEHPPPQVDPIEWLLVTTLLVTTAEEAFTCVRYYTYRWIIERFHYVLKSGCRIEDLQLETADRLKRAIATYSYIAWRQLWLTYQARTTPDASCAIALEEHEWQALYCLQHKTSTPPSTPPSLQQAVLWIAMLGGFLARKADGQPGVKTIWRGLRRLHDIADAEKILHPKQHYATSSG